MATVVKGFLQRHWKWQYQIVRHRSKINITKPKPLHHQRAIVEQICVPYFHEGVKRRRDTLYGPCNLKEVLSKPKENPLEAILAKDVLNWFDKSSMIAFFHQNETNMENIFQAQVQLKNNKMKCFKFGKQVMKKALVGTVYEPALILFQSHTMTAVSKEPNIPGLLNVSKKLPTFVLMAAIVNQRLLNVSELKYYAKYESLEAARANLLGVLNGCSQNLLQKINHVPNRLLQLLNQHQEQMKDKD